MIRAQEILELLNDSSFDFRTVGNLSGLSEERIQAAEAISYNLYSKAITYLFSEEYSPTGLQYISEDYVQNWGNLGGEPPSDPESTHRRGIGYRQERDEPRSEEPEKSKEEPLIPPEVSKSNSRLGQIIYDIFMELGSVFKKVFREFGIVGHEIVAIFKEKPLYHLLRVFGFSLKAMVMSMGHLAQAINKGLFRTLEELYETRFVNDLKNGLTSIDKVISEKPLLKLLGGPTMAGFLLMVKLTDLLSGRTKYSKHVSFETMARALGGQYSIKDFLASPSAMLIDVLSLIGLGSYVSVNWLASGLFPIAVVLLVIGLKLLGKKPPAPVERKIQYGT